MKSFKRGESSVVCLCLQKMWEEDGESLIVQRIDLIASRLSVKHVLSKCQECVKILRVMCVLK